MSGNKATVGALRVSLGINTAAFSDGLKRSQKQLNAVGEQMQRVGAKMAGVGVAIGAALAGAFAAVTTMTSGIVEMGNEAETAGVSFEAFQELKYVAEQAGVSVEALTDGLKEMNLRADEFATTGGGSAAEAFARIGLSGADLTEALKDPAAMFDDLIVRIGKLDNAAQIRVADEIFGGTGGEQFVRMLDLGAEGIARLRQEFVAGGGLISQEQLERAAAFQTAMSGLKTALSGLAVNLLMDSGLIEFFSAAIPKVTAFAQLIAEKLSPGFKMFAVAGAALAAVLAPLLIAVGALTAAMGAIIPVVAAVGLPFLAVAAAVAAVGAAFYIFRDDIIPILQSFAASLQENLGPKIEPLWAAIKEAASAVGELFTQIFGDGSPGSAAEVFKVFGEIIARVLGAAVDIITGAIEVITNVLRAFGALLRGDFSAMWGYLGAAVGALARGIVNAFQTLFPEVVEWVRKTYEGVKQWLFDRFADLVRGIVGKIGEVKDAFFNLYDAVVGNSYIPDLVEAIAEWMGPRLQAAMVDPALASIDETSAAFEGMATDVDSIMEGLFQSIINKDWKGALGGILDIFAGKDGKGLGGWAKIAGDILGKLPGFKTGGSFKVGGSGGADSQTVAFRATPGEMVDIRRPGQSSGGQSLSFDLRGAVMTTDLLRQMESMAVQSGGAAFTGARRAVPLDLGRRQRFSYGV